MKRFETMIAVLTVLVIASPAAANQYGWTISHSSTDPFVNAAPSVGGATFLYLHYACNQGDGMSAAQFSLVSSDGGTVLALVPLNGFLNAGTAQDLLLAVGACPDAPTLAARLITTSGASFSIAVSDTINGTVDCGPVIFTLWEPNNSIGVGPNGGAEGDIACGEENPLRRSRRWVSPSPRSAADTGGSEP